MARVTRAAFETQQFFELDIPEGMTTEQFLESDAFLKSCADLILSGNISFQIERRYNAAGEEI